MTDYFALLGEPRRPWLDEDALKLKFLALAAEAHPDKQHGSGEPEKAAANRRYAELNAACQCLREPKSRLLHLLQLELGTKPADVQQIPPILADLFAEVATTCRNADTFLAEKNRTTSPLLQAQSFERGQEWVDRLRELQKKLAGFNANLLEELKSVDAEWISTPSARTVSLNRLEELYRLFGYFNRWNSQIQERIVQLSF